MMKLINLEKTEIEEFKFYNYEEKYQTISSFSRFIITVRIIIAFYNF